MYQELSTLAVINLYALQQAFPDTSFPAGGPNDQWLAEHGFMRYVQPVEPVTQDQIISDLQHSVQNHLDDTARTRNYDGILSLASYAGDPDPLLDAEGAAGKLFRSGCWRKCYAVMADVQDGKRPIPTSAELIAELPEMVWP